jgi:hypothetical protein
MPPPSALLWNYDLLSQVRHDVALGVIVSLVLGVLQQRLELLTRL